MKACYFLLCYIALCCYSCSQEQTVDIDLGMKNIPVNIDTNILVKDKNGTIQRSLKSLIVDTRTEIIVDFDAVDEITFNKAYLESIFLNLISNSIKYAKPNTYPHIYIHSQKTNDLVTLSFKDNGIGIDMKKVKDRIFGFNQTFHDNKDSKGIGLYLVNNHLTSLGGHIEIESEVNEGALFTITFKS